MALLNLHFLHGFLGQASDFDALIDALKNHLEFEAHRHDLFAPSASPILELDEWGRGVPLPPKPRYLVGYSMGGRLALHLAQTHKYDGVILLSTFPRVLDARERTERAVQDQIWSQRFLTEDWSTLVMDWNRQPVLVSSHDQPRLEENFDRKKLARALRVWSQVESRVLFPQALTGSRLIWMVGANDRKYMDLMEKFRSQNPDQTVVIVPNAGHRLHLDQPLAVAAAMAEFFVAHSSHKM